MKIHFEILSNLLSGESCPRAVLAVCGQGIIQLIASKLGSGHEIPASLDTGAIQARITDILGRSETSMWLVSPLL